MKAIVMEVDDWYFKTIVGRNPKTELELWDFAQHIKKSIDYSVDWDEINTNAKEQLEETDH